MRIGSICSGISADSVAWHPLGWQHQWFCEIDKFCCAVLRHHYPTVPNYGDFTKKNEGFSQIDLLMVSTPCQDFSIAGKRGGFSGARGSLTMSALGVIKKTRPRWIVFENVPGLLSADCSIGFRDFLNRLAELGYGFSYRILDAQYAGLAQRRERVFLVGHLGNWRHAAAVFLDLEGMQGNPAPRREERENVAGCLGGGSGERGWCPDTDRMTFVPDISMARNAKSGTRPDGESETFIPTAIPILEPGARTGTSTNDPRAGIGIGSDGDPMFTLSGKQHAVGFSLNANAGRNQIESNYVPQRMGVRRLTPRECERLMGFPDDYTLIPEYRKRQKERGDAAMALHSYLCRAERGRIHTTLTDGRVYCTPDGPRYKALGNSIAVPELRWIGERIRMVESCT